MGKYLQVRVSVSTFNPDEVQRAWPILYDIAWPGDRYQSHERLGVLELVEQLRDIAEFGELDKDVKKILNEELPRVAHLRQLLDLALGDWNATEAEKLTTRIEDALGELENRLTS
ncbi:hypothetical protein [Desulfohalovibrio reitneri]|uniref:hypothetical protein n=1 Tax=Desulfohalovibrio reitneri TaxID=1307759 RepID=UPI0004A6F405|nr:hypothetical protein [Desulfohalovibrio reitneri]